MSEKVQIKEVKHIKEYPYHKYIEFLKSQMYEISKVPKELLKK
jgi:hypothetical protein